MTNCILHPATRLDSHFEYLVPTYVLAQLWKILPCLEISNYATVRFQNLWVFNAIRHDFVAKVMSGERD